MSAFDEQKLVAAEPGFNRARISALDWLMLALALISIGLLSYETWGTVSEEMRHAIYTCDVLICLAFAVEFVWRWRQTGWQRAYVLRNWYEILGMIPLAHPAVRGFRLFRLIRIISLLSRFGMAADRSFGDEFTYRLLSRFKKAVVDSIGSAITIAVIDEVSVVLNKGTYTANISRALQENQSELRTMIVEKLRDDPQTGRLKRIPFYDDIVESVIDAALRVIESVLKDPRTDEMVADMLRENLTQIQSAVRARADAQHETAAALK